MWTLGVWSNNESNPGSHFDVYGQFTDILFEQDGAGKSPTPLLLIHSDTHTSDAADKVYIWHIDI